MANEEPIQGENFDDIAAPGHPGLQSESAAKVLDPHITMLNILNDLLFVLLGMSERKPADDRVWQALGRLDATRRQLQRELGQEPTQVEDIHGRASYVK